MKTVSAEIISSKPVSLSRAAKFLSNFVEFDNGASRTISTYLRHTSDAFNELTEFHKKLKSSGSNRKSNRSYASSGISTVQNEPSTLSSRSSEGEQAAEKRKERNRKKGVDEGHPVHVQEIGVDGSESTAHGEELENDFEENVANGGEDNSEAVTEKKRHKKKHMREDQNNESAENGGKAQERVGESVSKTSVSKGLGEGVGDDFSEKSSEKKRTKKKKKKKGEEGEESLQPNGVSTGEKEVSEGRYENNVSIGLGEGVVVDLREDSSEKKGKRKKKKGDEDRDSLLPNDASTGEMEISEAKSGSEEGKKEIKKKRKVEEAAMGMELDGSTEQHRKKKSKKRMAD